MFRRAGFVPLLVFLAASPAVGQEWARKMFKETQHDFGSVARGAKAEHEFVLSNIYLEDVHVANVRSSCGCTTPRIKTAWLKTYEEGAIVAAFNTRSFYGRRSATITVTIDRPFYAEVRLQVGGYIRSDVVFQPGSVQLGSVDQGSPAEARLVVDYAGRRDWKILEVKSANPYLSGEVVQLGRGVGRVKYDLVVRLDKDAPAGYLSDRLLLTTNDQRSRQIPLLVEGHVTSAVTVSPASLFMGVVEPGKRVTKKLVVRGKKPFRILSIACDDESFEFETSGEEVASSVHLVPVTFLAGKNSGKIAETIRIQTDLGTTVPELAAYAVVLPQ